MAFWISPLKVYLGFGYDSWLGADKIPLVEYWSSLPQDVHMESIANNEVCHCIAYDDLRVASFVLANWDPCVAKTISMSFRLM